MEEVGDREEKDTASSLSKYQETQEIKQGEMYRIA